MTQAALKQETTDVSERYLCFSLGPQSYAIPLLSVREVIALPEITPVPTMPSYFLGIMNLRGQVISVIDLRKKLGITPSQSSEQAIIICAIESVCLGIVVDSINSVLEPEAANISDAPPMQETAAAEYVLKVFRDETNLTLLMDIARVLNVADRRSMSIPVTGKQD
jgi:purine-binding chemotaxis protein CheW